MNTGGKKIGSGRKPTAEPRHEALTSIGFCAILCGYAQVLFTNYKNINQWQNNILEVMNTG